MNDYITAYNYLVTNVEKFLNNELTGRHHQITKPQLSRIQWGRLGTTIKSALLQWRRKHGVEGAWLEKSTDIHVTAVTELEIALGIVRLEEHTSPHPYTNVNEDDLEIIKNHILTHTLRWLKTE